MVSSSKSVLLTKSATSLSIILLAVSKPIFSNSSIKPYYYPIFMHQWRADGIESERYISPRLSEYKIIKRRIKTFLKITLPGKIKILFNIRLPDKN